MKKVLFIIFIAITMPIYANDGGVAIIGDSFHPINITNVSMDYERLNITCGENYFEIEAYIELNNHDVTVSETLLGFEFHEGNLGHLGDYDISKNIKDYILLVNSVAQKFEYKFEEGWEAESDIHILIYKPKLNPGKNMIYHKFKLPYGFGSEVGRVSYILKTSSRWKDGIIKNLEIFIKTDNSTILFFEESDWSNSISAFDTIGESKLYQRDVDSEYYSLTPNGYLYKNIENFIPDRNISFQLLKFSGMEQYFYYENSFITIYDWKRYIENKNFRRYRWGDDWFPSEKMLEELSAIELRILRNTLYAIHGHVFNDNFLQDYFNKQYWYFPNPNRDDIVLDMTEQKILEYIIEEESKR